MAVRILLSKKLGELRWTQADLSRKTGIRAATINEWYHGFAERISIKHLDDICEALNCEITDILVRVPNSDSELNPRAGRPKDR